MQSGRPGFEQFFAQGGDDIEPECADRLRVVAITFQLDAHPARDLRAAGIREPGELGEIADRHDARHDGNANPGGGTFVDKTKVGIGIVEILRDGRIRARVYLAFKVLQFVGCVARLRVVFRIARDLDVEPIARCFADERHELVCVSEFAARSQPGRHVTTQSDDMANAVFAITRKRRGNLCLARRNAGYMRGRVVAGTADFQHGIQRALLGGSAGAEGHRKKTRLQLRKLLPRGAQLHFPLRCFGGEKFETEVAGAAHQYR